jgi:hypothetical protein
MCSIVGCTSDVPAHRDAIDPRWIATSTESMRVRGSRRRADACVELEVLVPLPPATEGITRDRPALVDANFE